ncbi:MAG TPA: PfkB family carbohydrate kinase [Candidatus Methylomirabilis sp.]
MRIDLPIPQDKPFDVVGVGVNVIDYLFRIPHFPEPNTKMDALGATIQGGGLTATAMVACARLDLRTRYIGKFGDNEIGRMARQELLAEGLDLAGSVVAEGVPNRFCVVLVEEGSGHRTIVRQRDPRIWLTPAELTREAVCAGRSLHLDGHEGDAALQAARWAKQAGVLVSVDAEEPTQHREELFPLADVLIVSQRFARGLTGKTAPADILQALARFGPACVGLTLGEAGSALLYRGRLVDAPGFPVEVVDTTGAGDVFHGAFLYGLLQGWDARDILVFANAVSALKCTRLGGRSGIPRVDDVHAFLRARGAAIPTGASRKEP